MMTPSLCPRRFRTMQTCLLATLLAAGCSSGSPSSAGAAPDTAASNAMEVVKVTTQKLNASVGLPGELVPYEAVAIYPKITAFVKSIAVDRGSRVRQGDLLVELEAPELSAQRSEAESKVAAAQSQLIAAQAKLAGDQVTYERLAAASQTPGVVAGNELDLAARTAEAGRANVAAAQDAVQAADAARNAIAQIEAYLRVTAPFDGVITERNVHPGALVGPGSGAATGTPMLRVQTMARLRLIVPVPENSVSDVPAGAAIRFSVPAYPAEIFQAPVARVSHAIDPRTRTMPVELDVANAASRLTPGTFCQVQWPVRRSYATHFVPPSAVATNQQRTFVIRVPDHGSDAGKADWVDVQAGSNTAGLVEVFGDLNDGDRVVLRASDAIRPGSPVVALQNASNP